MTEMNWTDAFFEVDMSMYVCIVCTESRTFTLAKSNHPDEVLAVES